jgi:radical SAM protein with 4Fe4S-binding SPASM domain
MVKVAIDRLSGAGVLNLALTGGEIFVRHDILDILGHAVSKDFFAVGLMTNGILLSERHIRFLIDHAERIRSVSLSVFSHRPEVNDAYFGIPGALDRIRHTARALSTGGVATLLKIYLIPENAESLYESVVSLRSEGFRVQVFAGLLLPPERQDNLLGEKSGKDDTINTEAYFSRYYEVMARLGEMAPPQEPVAGQTVVHSGICHGLFTSLFIDQRGDVFPCTVLPSIRIGSLFDELPLQEMLKACEPYTRLRSMSVNTIPECSVCPVAHWCNRCLGQCYNESPDLSRPARIYCHETRARLKRGPGGH